MRKRLRCWLLAFCTSAFMATTTLAELTYSLKVSEINGTPIALGKACCSGQPDVVCTPEVVGAPCAFNFECTNPLQPACKPVVCDIANPSHCPIGNSTCQFNVSGNACTLPTELNVGDVVPGDVFRVDAFLKDWDEFPNLGICIASDSVGDCQIVPGTCEFKTVCSDTGNDCNSTRLCLNNVCQATGGVACMIDADCANLDCPGGGACILNECQITPLVLGIQWSFDVPSLSSGSTGMIAIDSAFIQKDRSDYLFFGQSSWNITAIFNNFGLLEYSSLLNETNPNATPVLDIGEEKYFGTIMLSPSVDAAGTFTLGFSPTPGVNFFNNEIGEAFPVSTFKSVTINFCDVIDSPNDCNGNSIPDECEPDVDGDGVIDACDPCPLDADDDSDGDGVCDSDDGCPTNPLKIVPGACGCANPEDDSDGDGVPDCVDLCSGVDDTIFGAQCAGAIPTVSTWGLAILTLLLMVGGKLYFRRTLVSCHAR